MGNTHTVGPFFNELAAKSFGITLEESFQIPSCSAGLFGLDFSHPLGQKALNALYSAALDPHAFFSERWDQNALSVILHQLEMHEKASFETCAQGKDQIMPQTLFLIDRGFVQKWK